MVDVPYHTHEFTIPTASEGEIRAGIEDGKAITPGKLAPVLADKADRAITLEGYGIEDAATKAQGDKADTAVQPEEVSAVGSSGEYSDLLNPPALGGAAALDIGYEANTVAAGDDPRIVGAVQKTLTVSAGVGLSGGGDLASNIELGLSSTTLASLVMADSAVQPSVLKSLAYKDLIGTSDIDAAGSDDSDAILTKGGLWIKPTGVGDMLQSVWEPIISENTSARHTHANKTVLDNTTASFTTVQEVKLSGIASGATANIGTVTNVGIAVPSSFTATGAITTSGTITIKYAEGYQGYTTAEANKLNGVQTGAQVNSVKTVAGRTGDIVLAAADIASGLLAEARIPTLSAGKIPDLDASKITSGAFADARIPNLNASKTNAGVFAEARIPKNVGIGAGQSWQNVTRSHNTSYQNTSGKPIMVSIRNHEMGGTYSGYFEVSTNGSTWLPIGEPFYDGPDKGWRFAPMGPFIVPTGHYYRYTSNKNPDWWRELR